MVIKFKEFEIKTIKPYGYQLTVFRMGKGKDGKPKMQEDVTYPGSIESALNSALRQITNNAFDEEEEISINEYLEELKRNNEYIKKQLEAEKICL